MTTGEQIITIAMCVIGTMLTRFIPFAVFRADRPTPKYIQYLGKALPAAIFGMLIVYYLKDVNIFTGMHGIPELIGIVFTVIFYLWKRNMLIAIAAGTFSYMLIVNF